MSFSCYFIFAFFTHPKSLRREQAALPAKPLNSHLTIEEVWVQSLPLCLPRSSPPKMLRAKLSSKAVGRQPKKTKKKKEKEKEKKKECIGRGDVPSNHQREVDFKENSLFIR